MLSTKKNKKKEEEEPISKMFFPYNRKKIRNISLENRDLENYNFQIYLRDCLSGNIKLSKLPEEELFIHLHKSNLKGNKIIGDLTPMLYKGYPIYFHYNENTFDEEYKKQHPTFFLDDKAPEKLKSKYYGIRYVFEISCIDGILKKSEYHCRNTLSLQEYLEYYQFLKGKNLSNFRLEPKEYLIMQIIEKYGLVETKKRLKELINSPFSFYGILFNLLSEKKTTNYNPFPLPNEISDEEEIERILAVIKKAEKN